MSINRRQFIGTTAGASLACVASNVFAESPTKKIRFAHIGTGGRGGHHINMWRNHDIVAVCDTNRKSVDKFNSSQFPKLGRYSNFLEMYEKEMDNIDAVIVATPDHCHYPAAMLALMAGKAVYCEKPLAWSVTECLELSKMARKMKVATQMGNQGNAGTGWRDVYSMVHQDIIGDVKEVHTWTNRPIWPQGKPRSTGEDPIPETLDWNAWIGPAPMRPYKGGRTYEPFVWRGYYDFGCGALGDMACHTMNAMFQTMKPEYSCTVEPLKVVSPTDDQFPSQQIIKWSFARKKKCPGFDAYWYDGGLKPEKPDALGNNALPGTGVLFLGTKGALISQGDYNNRNSVYIKGEKIEPKFERMVKPSDGGYHGEFVKAASGEKPWDSPMSNFMYAGKMTAIINMGTVAQRVGEKIKFSSWRKKFDNKEANALMARKPREGWEKAYDV
jgi:predicted dehydrogenase